MQAGYTGRDNGGFDAMTLPPRATAPSFRGVRGWAVAVLVAMVGVVLARVMELVDYWHAYQLLRDHEKSLLSAGQSVREIEDQTASSWASSVGWFAQMVCGALFVVWTYRSRRNTESFCAAPHRLSRGWAVAGFLPIVNWFLPPVVINDIQRASDPATPPDASRLVANSTTPLVLIWWTGFVTGSTLLFVAYLFGIAPRSGAAGTDRAALGMLIGFGGVLLLVSAAVTSTVILFRVTAWQEAKAPVAPRACAEVEPPVPVQRNLGHHSPPPSVRPLAPVGALGNAAAALSVAVVAGPTIVAIALPRYRDVENAREGTPEYDAAMDDWAPLMLFGLLTWTLTLFLAGSVFLFWLLRARLNAETLDPAGQRLSRGWAVGSWFVPVGNVIIPAIVVDDVYRASRHGMAPARWPVVAWWIAWVSAWAVGWIGLAFAAAPMLWVSALLFALAAPLLTMVILHINAGQRAALSQTRLAADGSGPAGS
ncbi:DUF4328 domain-containing protein [Nocardia asteroides]